MNTEGNSWCKIIWSEILTWMRNSLYSNTVSSRTFHWLDRSGHLGPLAPPPYLWVGLFVIQVVLVGRLIWVTDFIQQLDGQSPTERLRDKRVLGGGHKNFCQSPLICSIRYDWINTTLNVVYSGSKGPALCWTFGTIVIIMAQFYYLQQFVSIRSFFGVLGQSDFHKLMEVSSPAKTQTQRLNTKYLPEETNSPLQFLKNLL